MNDACSHTQDASSGNIGRAFATDIALTVHLMVCW